MEKILEIIFLILIIIIIITILLILSIIIKYRFSISKKILLKREIVYQVIDLGQGDFFRTNVFEYILKKKRIFTLDQNNKKEWFFVTENDYNKCWHFDDNKLDKTKETLLLTIECNKLFFGGYSPAKIIEIEKINKKAIISK